MHEFSSTNPRMAACPLSLYSDYILEREGRRCIEDSEGFVTFKILGKECYIQEVYIVPEKRRSGKGREFVNKVECVAKEKGCLILTTTVCPSTNNSTESITAILKTDFKLMKSELDLIWFAKEIK